MAKSRDYIPHADADLLVFSKNLYIYALEKCKTWGVPSPKEILETDVDVFETALTTFNDPNHGKIDTANKNTAKHALIRGLRIYIQAFVARNPHVSSKDKEHMQLPLRDNTPTVHPIPDVRPEAEAVPSGKGMHTVTAINPRLHTKTKPERVSAVAYARRIRGQTESVLKAEDMPSEIQSRAVKVFRYEEEDYGKVVHYAVAYVNASGKRGPWSNVVSLIISG
jgi:hypothetical protein